MEVTSLCIRLLLNVLLLLAAHGHHSYVKKGDAAFLSIIPTRLQFFEYESLSFTCEGFTGSAKWRGVRNIKEYIPTCSNSTVTSTVTCTISSAFETDSGEYWCEAEGGERSNTINITVTAGSVILESPALPVMEGDAVTLRCRNNTSSANLPAVFSKDGLFIGSSSVGKITIHSVYKSHEGLYKCNISGVGESAESWLAVRVLHKDTLRIVLTAVMVALLLLLLVGLLNCGKLSHTTCPT
ncbi:low affinity immunoglobulin gamma Fc region receptor II-like isoform X1 [Perca flavescens]|uniref:low affinity immunoglobulin gamma Fc region receptor II-like isoform X1 n=1 Tax=Perca flavescens TaxID=8167 RepID=UPI00106EB317|nr:low affinity immunoglobulin gamma Fc region receptor II-like isoform X1 [Perca flavescens]XP_028461957.1 low affinity immunoglobulin gamma Fc region receptor II-like isoform X1 [Perca flavescens]XP_028461958.1 low affinity immunoglobulin gamma Fc region receptor II-like isoform X1 [Perca flavescens]XP_028461959.1 low affinity immunoglobulin gamma Fc region receptor II-like isoform X1 [Perca flavescens]XP_028461960.1 low affinity immunoglobulin gamma Fc region receptor II-like isoform X1 [Per